MLLSLMLVALFVACSCGDDRPAPVGTFGGEDWPDQVDQEFAQQDGLSPDDFDFLQWPVSDVRLQLPVEADGLPATVGLIYRCAIPADTPQADQYDDSGQSLSDPVGLALAWVQFALHDVDDGDVVDRDDRGHTNGQVEGFVVDGADLWQRLVPGASLRVRLTAQPFFFYLSADGADHTEYTTEADGYFKGEEASSGEYLLSMDEDGNVLVEKE